VGLLPTPKLPGLVPTHRPQTFLPPLPAASAMLDCAAGGHGGLQDCETSRQAYLLYESTVRSSMSALDMFGSGLVWSMPSNDFCTPRLPLLGGSPLPGTTAPAKRGRENSPLIHAGALFCMARQTTGRPARTRQWLQHPSSDMGPAPETRNSAWRLESWSGQWQWQWQRIQPPDGARECLSCESRPPTFQVKGFGPAARYSTLYSTVYFEIPTSRRLRCAALNRPAMHMLLLALRKAMLSCSSYSVHFGRVPSPHELPTVAALALHDRAPTARLLCNQKSIW
jgi:hypothetical protein